MNSEVCLIEIPIVIENTVFTIIDECFESETGELDHHTSNNNIVEDHSMDNPDVINVEVDIPMNDTSDELSKCFNVFTVACGFGPFESNRVKEFHQHLRAVHGKTYGIQWTYSDTCSERILLRFSSRILICLNVV